MTDEDNLITYMKMVADYIKTDPMAKAIVDRCGVDDEFTVFMAALYKALELQRKIAKEKKEND